MSRMSSEQHEHEQRTRRAGGSSGRGRARGAVGATNKRRRNTARHDSRHNIHGWWGTDGGCSEGLPRRGGGGWRSPSTLRNDPGDNLAQRLVHIAMPTASQG
jgi:hypothetical protein